MPRRPTPRVQHGPVAPMTTTSGGTSTPVAKAPAKPKRTPIPDAQPINELAGQPDGPPAHGLYDYKQGKSGPIGPGV
jgi:hypothetical protein